MRLNTHIMVRSFELQIIRCKETPSFRGQFSSISKQAHFQNCLAKLNLSPNVFQGAKAIHLIAAVEPKTTLSMLKRCMQPASSR